MARSPLLSALLFFFLTVVIHAEYRVAVVSRPSTTVMSNVDGTSSYSLVFNPSWVEATPSNGYQSGLLMRTQNCTLQPGDPCAFCGGSADKASVLTFGRQHPDGSFQYVDSSSVVFGPHDETDSWGTEDPRIKYNRADGLYYMFYTAYNGHDIFLSLATTFDPTVNTNWTYHGAVFPEIQNSKSGALLIGEKGEGSHHLYWGDSSIKIATSNDLLVWPSDGGRVFLEIRDDHFDSKLVESGPPPLQLLNGDYIFFYNSATVGWPDDPDSAYHPGWVILDRKDPSVIKQRAEVPLLTPQFAWELGVLPYTCNVPNVIFLEAAHRVSDKHDHFQVYFGGADAVVGMATVQVTTAE